MDKDSATYDKKAEKKFRDLIETFVNWLKNADSESDTSSGSSSEKEENKEVNTDK